MTDGGTDQRTKEMAQEAAGATGTMHASGPEQDCAWATLLTGEKYLPGLAVFSESLLRSPWASRYPLVVMVPPDASPRLRAAIVALGCRLRTVDPLVARASDKMAAARFADVWTKLRAWHLTEFRRVVLVDSDMLVRRNMDELFGVELAPGTIRAGFACTCNPARIATYPAEWTPENCAFSPQKHPTALTQPTALGPHSPPTHHLLNSGLVVLTPDAATMDAMAARIATDAAVVSYRFPDQDFLADFFKGRFVPLPWFYNAIKKLRAVHPDMWRDDEVRNVHYIINKPWEARLARDDADYETHEWWWQAYRAKEWDKIITDGVVQ
ncbi:glycosyltransferase family 8 protein [Acaromyces ingoldii]|uniref:Glycosyltransferase family 8 protein n=1 Tax=Acaromyces ingoldii TaxID=215250 RepID=A0A316YIP6_9BASI|nr:glycosyltransferase family 8 protein [Acaromyces ingoldii]PWN88704.1 glycosyltransferase family 8 protein [Acaromyces ingoldii]